MKKNGETHGPEHLHTEVEFKYEVPWDLQVPERFAEFVHAGTRETHRLQAVYFDTAQGDFAQAHIALRLRAGGNDSGWHLKKRVDAHTQREYHWGASGEDAVFAQRIAGGELNGAQCGTEESENCPLRRAPEGILRALHEVLQEDAASEENEFARRVGAASSLAALGLRPVVTMDVTRESTIFLDNYEQALFELANDTVRTRDFLSDRRRMWKEWELERIYDFEDREDYSSFPQEIAEHTSEIYNHRSYLLQEVKKELLTLGAVPSPVSSKIARSLGRSLARALKTDCSPRTLAALSIQETGDLLCGLINDPQNNARAKELHEIALNVLREAKEHVQTY